MDTLKQKYLESLQAGMELLHNDGNLADVEIHVNGRTFHCHKAILAAVSPYFQAMFTGGLLESRQQQVTLQDVEEGPFERFIQFVYTGRAVLQDGDVVDMLRLAALFQVDCLQEFCEGKLGKQLKTDNCLELYRLACMYNCSMLKCVAWPAVLEGFSTVCQSDGFTQLTVEEVTAIVREDSLVTLDEENVCDAVLTWINYNVENRKKHAARLLSNVRLPHLSPMYIVTNLCKTAYLMEDTQCRQMIEEVQHYHLLPARQLNYSSPRMRYRADDDLEEVILVVTENSDENGSYYEGSCCLWAFTYTQSRWFTLSPIPVNNSPGMHFAVCSYGFDLYISGGVNNNKNLLRFESDRNDWTISSGQLRKGRQRHSMVAVGNSLYCLGGATRKQHNQQHVPVIGSIEEYYIPGQRWKNVGELNFPVHSPATAVSGEQILVFGGIDKNGSPLSCVQCFHTRLKECSIVSHLPKVTKNLITTTVGESVYVSIIDEDDSNVLKLTSDFGFVDAGFEIATDRNILGITQSEGNFIVLLEHCTIKGNFGNIMRVNKQTSKSEILDMQGNTSPKLVHACHRTYLDKRFLYHSYFQ